MKESDFKKFMEPSLYRILCLDRNATKELIKSSYRGLSKTFHPDIYDDPDAHNKFIQISFANEVLSNAEHKLKYDTTLDLYEANKKTEEKKKRQAEMQHPKKTIKRRKKVVKTTKIKPMTEADFKNEAWYILAKAFDNILKQMNKQRKRN